MKVILTLPLLCLLAACGPADNEAGPGGATIGEARALDEAAEMIEQRRLPPEAIAPADGAEPSEASGETASE